MQDPTTCMRPCKLVTNKTNRCKSERAMPLIQATSKAFKAVLPSALQDSALERLQAWARDNSSRSAIWRKNEGAVWVCTREKPRTQEAFMRHLRDLFAALYIQERPRGRWLALLTEEEAKQIIKTSDPTAPGAPTMQNLHDDDKVCLLTAPPRASRCNEAADVGGCHPASLSRLCGNEVYDGRKLRFASHEAT